MEFLSFPLWYSVKFEIFEKQIPYNNREIKFPNQFQPTKKNEVKQRYMKLRKTWRNAYEKCSTEKRGAKIQFFNKTENGFRSVADRLLNELCQRKQTVKMTPGVKKMSDDVNSWKIVPINF